MNRHSHISHHWRIINLSFKRGSHARKIVENLQYHSFLSIFRVTCQAENLEKFPPETPFLAHGDSAADREPLVQSFRNQCPVEDVFMLFHFCFLYNSLWCTEWPKTDDKNWRQFNLFQVYKINSEAFEIGLTWY